MIEIKNLYKDFGKKKVLKSIDLTINKGDKIAIIGPSGCGKSTLLRCINMLEIPTKGEVIFNGVNLCDKNVELNKVRQKMGMVFQQFNLFSHLSVIDNITLAPIKLGIMSREKAQKEAKRLLKSIDLLDKKDEFPTSLSGGEKQRVAIVRSLILKPEIILFDEPTSALDPEMVKEVTELMKKIADDGMTMVVVSHEMSFVEEFAVRVLFMEDGRIIEQGSSDDIFNHPKSKRLKEFLSKISK